MKLLCDEMLARLGRWLRAAGYDTVIAVSGTDDARLIEMAAADERILLTRDRGLAARASGGPRIVVLRSAAVTEQARELARGLAIDWLMRPFTRCVVDNALLRPAAGDEADGVPPEARALGGPVFACPACRRLYWEGSHHRRMRARLESWRQ